MVIVKVEDKDNNKHKKIRKMAVAQQACSRQVSDEAHTRGENGAAVALTFDKARRGGFYTRVGNMTSILQGQRLASKIEYKRMRIVPVADHLASYGESSGFRIKENLLKCCEVHGIKCEHNKGGHHHGECRRRKLDLRERCGIESRQV